MILDSFIQTPIRVLLADREPSFHESIREMLASSESGCELDPVVDHQAALAAIAGARHHVYLLPFDPAASGPGLELLAAVGRHAPDAAAIVLLDAPHRRLPPEAAAAGADDFLPRAGLSDLLLERTLRYALERRRAAGAPRRNSELLHTVVSAAPLAVATFDRSGVLLSADGRAIAPTGIDTAPLIGTSLFETCRAHPELIDALGRALAGQEAGVRIELSGRVFECRLQPSFDADGSVAGGVAIATDITEQSRSELAMRRSEEYLRLLAEHTLDVVAIVDRNGITTYTSPSSERIFGYPAGERVGRRFFEHVHPDDQQEILEVFNRLTAVPLATARVEFRYRHHDGSWRYIETVACNLLEDPVVCGVFASARDITERRAAVDALRQSRELFRSFMEHSPAISFIKDEHGRYVYLNSRLASMIRQTVDAVIGRTDEEVFPALDSGIWKRQDELVLTTQQMHTFEESIGGRYWLTVKFPIVGEGGQRLLGGFIVDVTERRVAEEALRASQERFQLVALATRDAIWDWNVLTDALWLSPNTTGMFGYPMDRAAVGFEWWFSRVHPDDRARIEQGIQRLTGERRALWVDEYRFLRGDGTYATILDRAYAVYDADGRMIRMIGAMSDVSDWKQSEQALRASEAKYRKIVETTREGVWVADERDITTFVNARMTEILGYSAEEMIGRSYAEFMDAVAAETAHTKSGQRRRGIAEQYDLMFRRKDGSMIWTIVSANPIFDDRGEYAGSLALITDITDRKRAEEALQEAHDQLERRVRERTAELTATMRQLEAAHLLQKQFVADASHHLRTPLTVIHAELELLLLRDTVPLPQGIVDALRRIDAESLKLRNLANDLLLLARLDIDALPDKLRPIRLDEMLLDCITKLAPLTRGKDIAWDIEIEDPVELVGDRSSLEHAISNVLENGIKYSEPQSVIRVAIHATETTATIAIANRGPGIADNEVAHVFDRFYRGLASTSMPGTGLGLAIVKTVIDRHGGTINATSDPELGTTFTITLPLGNPSGPQSDGAGDQAHDGAPDSPTRPESAWGFDRND